MEIFYLSPGGHFVTDVSIRTTALSACRQKTVDVRVTMRDLASQHTQHFHLRTLEASCRPVDLTMSSLRKCLENIYVQYVNVLCGDRCRRNVATDFASGV